MHTSLLVLLLVLFTLANVLTSYLYLYPILHQCSFPAQPERHLSGGDIPQQIPPFRLLILADPQLEGDSSLLNPEYGYLPHLSNLWSDVSAVSTIGERLKVTVTHLRDIFAVDIPSILQSYRKRLDLIGNDYYLAHIYRTMHWTMFPTHITVLGDLIGSQWVSDEEFDRRGTRYWKRVLQKGNRIEDERTEGIHIEPLPQDGSWARKVINVAGNHDIGYAGDLSREKMQRYERMFGRANWETRFSLPLEPLEQDQPELKLVVLNSLNLDGPVLDAQLQTDTYDFVNEVIRYSRPVEDRTTATILLTHLPLHKEAGVCIDGPFIDYYGEEHGGGIREQNHLSDASSKGILEGIYGMSGKPDAPGKGRGRNGIILTGHDHEGCDVYHHLSDAKEAESRTWIAEKWNSSTTTQHNPTPGIREITVRSMMGDFGGNAGLLSAWFDLDKREWQFEYATCALGQQHFWWAVHVLDIVTVVLLNYVGWSIFRATNNSVEETGKVKTL